MIGDLKIPPVARKLVHNAFIHNSHTQTHKLSRSKQCATHFSCDFISYYYFQWKALKWFSVCVKTLSFGKFWKFDTQSFYMKQNTIEMSECARDILLLFVPMMTIKWFSKLQNISIKIDRVIEAEICILVCKSYVTYIIMCSMFESLEINCWRNILVRHIRTFAPSKDSMEIRREKNQLHQLNDNDKRLRKFDLKWKSEWRRTRSYTAHAWVVSIFQLYRFQTTRIFKLTITRSKNLTESF